jgi:hypothetical protein
VSSVDRAPWIGMTRGFWKDDRGTTRPTGRVSRTSGSTATGPRSTRTDSGTSSDARTTRSRLRGNASGPAEVGVGAGGTTRRSSKPAASAFPTNSRVQALVCFCVLRQSAQPGQELATGTQGARRRTPRQAAAAGANPFRAGPAEDAQRQSDAARDSALRMSEKHPGDLSSLENPTSVARHRTKPRLRDACPRATVEHLLNLCRIDLCVIPSTTAPRLCHH